MFMETLIAVAILVTIIVSDIIFALDKVEGNTYSEMVVKGSEKLVIIPLWVGVIFGHWVLLLGTPRPKFGLFYIIGLTIILALIDAFSGHWLATRTNPAQWAFIGIALGSMFWGQG